MDFNKRERGEKAGGMGAEREGKTYVISWSSSNGFNWENVTFLEVIAVEDFICFLGSVFSHWFHIS